MPGKFPLHICAGKHPMLVACLGGCRTSFGSRGPVGRGGGARVLVRCQAPHCLLHILLLCLQLYGGIEEQSSCTSGLSNETRIGDHLNSYCKNYNRRLGFTWLDCTSGEAVLERWYWWAELRKDLRSSSPTSRSCRADEACNHVSADNLGRSGSTT